MRFDFETMPERHGMDSVVNFPTCPAVTEAVIRRAEHPLFGYFDPSDAYFDSIIRWQRNRNGVTGLEKKHIGYENGVLGGVISTLNAVCSRGDAVLLQTPAYIGFTHVLENNGYRIVHNPLIQDEGGVWRLDYEDMERKIAGNDIREAVFCNPHNPCGRVWTREEIRKAMDIFEKYGVWVVSDEIWSDLLLDGSRHTPVQSVSDYARSHTAAFYAPSKTFNLAGLVGSYHIIYDDMLRKHQAKEASLSVYNAMNVLSMHALIGAYSAEGEAWVDELRAVLSENVGYGYGFICDRFPGISVRKPEGTYMLFLHCEEWCAKHGRTLDDLLKAGTDVGVAWQDGRPFCDPWGIRMNLALPLHKVREAFGRLDRYVFNPEA